MPKWKDELRLKVERKLEEGVPLGVAFADVSADYQVEIQIEFEARELRQFKRKQRERWAEPDPDSSQLRFSFDGFEFAIPDTPVRFVDDDGEEQFKPASVSTGEERLDSSEHRIQHHQSWVRRSEAEHRRELEQIAAANDLNIDLMHTPFEEVRHASTECWRCNEGYRAGDPFERGHRDAPASQGGTVTSWEHRSCNRNAGDNPVAEPDADVA
jgi:hypothetical protein